MGFAQMVKRRARAAVAPAVFLALTGYFCWNAAQGERGLRAAVQQRETLRDALAEQVRADSDLAQWERRVASLRTSRLDPDALDERARAMLNLSEPSDLIVPLTGKQRLF